ncbi:MAG: PBECR2 nuclease fold domain-containing protein [Panacagrimonas sp.]
MAAAEYGSLPFSEQIEFFRQKVPLGTRAWTDIWEGEHARAFVVAGAMKDELLVDLRGSIDKAISEGTTLETFRKDFDQIVATHGWSYNGGRNWRTRVIYETNLRTSYQAARFKQMEEIKALRPFWEYRHSDLVQDPRPEHLAWDGLVLSADDPFWKTHYPPNGWGCQCTVFALSKRDLKARGKRRPDRAPEVEYETRTVGLRGPNPRTLEVPKGIDPGWGYNPGEAAWGRAITQQSIDRNLVGKWIPLEGQTFEGLGRPGAMPRSSALASIAVSRARTIEDARAILRSSIGGDQATLVDPVGARVVIDQRLVDHYAQSASRLDGRERYLPLLPELIREPYEIWVQFAREESTGMIGLRRRYLRNFDVGGGRSVVLIVQAEKGGWFSFDYFHRNAAAMDKMRQGFLVWSKP